MRSADSDHGPSSCLLQDSGELSVEEDRARLLRSPQQQQALVLSSEAVEAESREAAMRELQVWSLVHICHTLMCIM